MDQQSGKKVRLFRKREAVLDIFAEHKKSGLSIKAFCDSNNIAAASFHNWKKKHGNGKKARQKDLPPCRLFRQPLLLKEFCSLK